MHVSGMTLNLYSQIGLVMLVGLAAKNGILIVEFANQLRDRGMAFADAVVKAASIRLRPILMTSTCTAFGALPLLLAEGAGAYPKWNFYKYLVDRDGRVVDSFSSFTAPESPKLVSAIERLL